MINIEDANNYFLTRLFSDEWQNAEEPIKQSALNTAEKLITSHFLLQNDVEETEAYLHSVCEQAIHLLQFNKERFRLQNEGVTSYKVDDISINMNRSIISPIIKGFLKPILFKVGNVV